MSVTETSDGSSPPPLLTGPVKHSITIEKHQTSISLEPVFWQALRQAAQEEGVPLNALVARIDEERIAALTGTHIAGHPPANLASAIRCWLWGRYCGDAQSLPDVSNREQPAP